MRHELSFLLPLLVVGCQSFDDGLVALYPSAMDAVTVAYQQSFGPVPLRLSAHEDLEIIDLQQVGPNVACLVRDRPSDTEGWVAGDACRRLPAKS